MRVRVGAGAGVWEGGWVGASGAAAVGGSVAVGMGANNGARLQPTMKQMRRARRARRRIMRAREATMIPESRKWSLAAFCDAVGAGATQAAMKKGLSERIVILQ